MYSCRHLDRDKSKPNPKVSDKIVKKTPMEYRLD